MEQLLGGKQAMLAVHKVRDEHLVGARAQREPQVVAHRARRRQHGAAPDLLLQRAAGEFQGGLQLRCLGRAEAMQRGEVRSARRKQPAEAAEARQRLAGQVQCRAPGAAGTQEQRDQLGVAQDRRALRQQALARAFALGPILNRHAQPLD